MRPIFQVGDKVRQICSGYSTRNTDNGKEAIILETRFDVHDNQYLRIDDLGFDYRTSGIDRNSVAFELVSKYNESKINKNQTTIKTMLNKISSTFKKLTSPSTQTLYKAGFINGDLAITTLGSEELRNILFIEYQEKLLARAEEMIKEEEASK